MRRPPRSTPKPSSAASDVYKRQPKNGACVIETGFWGCGAFGGDPEIKAIIQLLAASKAGVDELVFYTFGDAAFAEEFKEILDLIVEKKVGSRFVLDFLFEARERLVGDSEKMSWKKRASEERFLFKALRESISQNRTQ